MPSCELSSTRRPPQHATDRLWSPTHNHIQLRTTWSQRVPRFIFLLVLLLHVGCCLSTADMVSANNDTTKHSYSAICVVAKNENRYIQEWVQYHKCLGIGTIYLYDHDSGIPMVENITEYVQSGYVKYIPFNGEHKRWTPEDGFADNLSKFSVTIQGKAYHDCLTRFSPHHTFMGFIDVDEFVVLNDRSLSSIDDLLKRYEAYGGLSLYWRLFGSSGRRAMSVDWVTKTFYKCLPSTSKQNTQFKSFVNTAFQPVMYSPHRAMFRAIAPNSFLVDENRNPIAAGRNKNSTHTVASVYHYATKSKQDFEVKMKRGGGAGVTRPRDYLRKLDRGCTDLCTEASLLYDRLCGAQPPPPAPL